MIGLRVTKRYVAGLIQIADEKGCLDEIEQALQQVDRLLGDNPELVAVLQNPTIPRERKKTLLRATLAQGVPEILAGFLDYVIVKKREMILPSLYAEYKRAADELRGIVRAKVKSAGAFSPAQAARLGAELGKRLAKRVEVESEPAPDLLGGLQVFIGSYVIDASISGRLARLHKHLLEEAAGG